jgi:hypothetical protein
MFLQAFGDHPAWNSKPGISNPSNFSGIRRMNASIALSIFRARIGA